MVVNVGHRLVEQMSVAKLSVMLQAAGQYLTHILCAQAGAGKQSSVGQTAMRFYPVLAVSRFIGRQQGHHMPVLVAHKERCILEAVFVVVHVAAVEQETLLPHLSCSFIPNAFLFRCIGRYLEIHASVVLGLPFKAICQRNF